MVNNICISPQKCLSLWKTALHDEFIQKKDNMQKLEDSIEIKGIGTMVTTSFVKRNGDICLYQRSDGPYEVFRVQVAPARNVFGSELPEREVYPGNEDFGKTAWCYGQYVSAKKKFDRLCHG